MAQYLSQTRIEGPIWLSPDEISFLRVQIADTEHQINLIEQQPSSPELEHQKDAKLGELSSLRNILSPVRRIPLEILSHIFEIHCPMSSERNPEFPHLRDVVQYTTVLSKVCVAWRDAVVATPKLLSRIFISTAVGIGTKSNFRVQASWIEQWLPRSQGVPLNLYLQLYSGHNKSIAIRATKLVEKLIPFRTQIRSLNLDCLLTIILPIFRLPSSSFPLLEELRLDIAIDSRYVVRNSEAFGGASHLRRLDIVEHHVTSVLELLALPLEQLTVLRIGVDVVEEEDDGIIPIPNYPDPAIYFDALRRCGENLVNLNLRLTHKFKISTFKSVRLFLPRLKILSISCSEEGNKDISPLSLLTSPLLEDLTLYLPGRYRPCHGDLGAEFTAFQERSAVTLTSLNVVNMESNEDVDNVIGLLAVLPTLTLLGIRRSVMDRFFQGLLFTEASPILLPKLISLEVHYWRYPSNLMPMILSRWWPDVDEPERNGVCRLQKVSLKGSYHEDISQLQSLSGLEVYWERFS